ncbi:hypothetical protein GOP47_0023954 [Adiantum capillus-veneris]|uniref:Uncharacterized protein n=1 Tax=Adiantum capillus-veneris TaxID=13818 RepID=A0A9D4Z4Y2_ADICA|nr:hypothetical protein GOP47_0023954 [Adiantum capillus-veneris]
MHGVVYQEVFQFGEEVKCFHAKDIITLVAYCQGLGFGFGFGWNAHAPNIRESFPLKMPAETGKASLVLFEISGEGIQARDSGVHGEDAGTNVRS